VIPHILIQRVFITPTRPLYNKSPHFFIPHAPLLSARTFAHVPPATTPRAKPIYTREEVSRHNTQEDCWIIIHGKVYNITSWVEQHPGGAIILANAGGDSTHMFEEMGHTHTAREIMKDYLIGSLLPAEEHRTRNDLSKRNWPEPKDVVSDF